MTLTTQRLLAAATAVGPPLLLWSTNTDPAATAVLTFHSLLLAGVIATWKREE